MIETRAGEVALTSFIGGYPHFVKLKYENQEIVGIHHLHLSDLEYAVKRHRELLKFKTNKDEPV